MHATHSSRRELTIIPVEFRAAWSLKITDNRLDGYYHRSGWDVPVPTLTCEIGQQQNPHCHPDELRGLSVEACAAIQTFPPGFCLTGSRNQRYKQLGNAVPVKFARAIAEHLKQHMTAQLQ
jgi:site-specific DNA-cytosine methylase